MVVRVDETTGRNVALFDSLRSFAYTEYRHLNYNVEKLQETLFDLANSVNGEFSEALPTCEIRSTVYSICRWVERKFSSTGFNSLQAHRAGLRWGDNTAKFAEVVRLRDSGLPWAEVAELMGLKMSTCRSIYNRHKKV